MPRRLDGDTVWAHSTACLLEAGDWLRGLAALAAELAASMTQPFHLTRDRTTLR